MELVRALRELGGRNAPLATGKSISSYERVFGGPNMRFLVSDIITDVYVPAHQFITINRDGVWTCYIPKEEKVRTLQLGQALYGDVRAYAEYKTAYTAFIDEYQNTLTTILAVERMTAEGFKNFVELCKEAERFYAYTQYFYTDTVPQDFAFEAEFGLLKERGRSLLNDQYLSENNYLERILREVAGVTGANVENLYLSTWKEIRDLLLGTSTRASGFTDRATFISYFSEGEKVTLVDGAAEAMIKEFLTDNIQDVSTLRGTIANKGKVEGIVRIFDHGYEHKNISVFIDAMRQGEILVAETTSPEIMAACTKASAIITNQGGLLSHAAITSRELKIPCIVGVEGATTILKTGDMVEVDAHLGTIQVLVPKQHNI